MFPSASAISCLISEALPIAEPISPNCELKSPINPKSGFWTAWAWRVDY